MQKKRDNVCGQKWSLKMYDGSHAMVQMEQLNEKIHMPESTNTTIHPKKCYI